MHLHIRHCCRRCRRCRRCHRCLFRIFLFIFSLDQKILAEKKLIMLDDTVVVKHALIILQREFVILSSLGATRFLDI